MCVCVYVCMCNCMCICNCCVCIYFAMCMHKAWHCTVCVCVQWDLADTPRWLTLHPREAYRGADGILILYSSTDMVGSTWLNGLTHVLYHVTEWVDPRLVWLNGLASVSCHMTKIIGWPMCCIHVTSLLLRYFQMAAWALLLSPNVGIIWHCQKPVCRGKACART